jgi:hypothetical protein
MPDLSPRAALIVFASVLDVPDLAHDEAQPRHIVLQLGRDIWRQRHTLRGM